MKKLLLLLAFFSFQFVNAQTKDTTDMILIEAEISPEFVGGDQAMYDFIGKHINYPAKEKENGITGMVVARFAIMADGSIDCIEILSKTPEGFNQEVIRVIKAMPKWKPGMQFGKPVPVYYSLPVLFRLR